MKTNIVLVSIITLSLTVFFSCTPTSASLDVSKLYQIVNMANNQQLTTPAGDYKRGDRIAVKAAVPGEETYWQFVPEGKGYYLIRETQKSFIIDLNLRNNQLIFWSRHLGDNQLWRVTENQDGSFFITPKKKEQHISVDTKKEEAFPIIEEYNQYDDQEMYVNQKWKLIPGASTN